MMTVFFLQFKKKKMVSKDTHVQALNKQMQGQF
jgi:hypothetical protein